MKAVLSNIFLLLCILLLKGVSSKKHGRLAKKNSGKIVGGSEVSIKDFPYQAHLTIQTDNGTAGCGGSIISNNYILTAAHCLPRAKKVYVRVGSDYTNLEGEESEASQFRLHPNYNRNTSDYDVAIVRLPSPITYGTTKQPISLPARMTPVPPGTNVTVSGWGTTEENGDSSDVLMAVTIQTISNKDCRRIYSRLTDNMLCAGVPEGGKDSCQGDSGGPAVSNKKLVGVVSFGIGCARPGYPGVYARVASPGIRDWIKRNTGV